MVRASQIIIFLSVLSSLNLTVIGQAESYPASSVLSSGRWFKMAVTEDGIYRIDYERLKQLGLEHPSNPRIFANNCGQLSFINDGSAPDDLQEIAIYESTGSDGVLNEGDHILFYGQGTGRWLFDTSAGVFSYLRHNYSDTAFYFLTSGQSQGKRMQDASTVEKEPDNFSYSSDALFIHESEDENLLHSGREWYQPISYTSDIQINPGFRDIITTETVKYAVRFLARAQAPTAFRLTENGSVLSTVSAAGVNLSSTTGTYAQVVNEEGEAVPSSATPVYRVSFINNGDISAKGWVDYVLLHARRLNKFDGTTTHYIDFRSTGPGIVTEFTINIRSGNTIIWDVTDPREAKIVDYKLNGSNLTFKSSTEALKTFVAFSVNNTISPVIASKPVINQDLHASGPADMVIVTHPLFLSHAVRLAEIHRKNSTLSSLVVTPEQIYNEFSGGVPDIVAIRNFLRMKFLLQKESGQPLRYLLLFGDGSFNNRMPPPGNTNYIPTYQSQNSNVAILSFTSDDFYGLLEEGEGEDTGSEDLGIGRLPVSDTAEATIVVSKIERYLSPSNQGDWKNMVCITADDEDGNTHISDAEGLADLISETAPWINVDKIYFDAFNQVTSPSGQFYPDVKQAINDRINSGTLLFNYIGHGNELSLGHERVITPESLNQWKNISKLPLFITATCEFSRFDDIIINGLTGDISGKYSTGEKILLDERGGAIALMSTTRLVYSAPNYALNRNIFSAAFGRDTEGKALRLGDIIRIAKNRLINNINKRNFLLLGDPAVRLSWPWHGNVVTDSINNVQVGEHTDSLNALSLVTVRGHVEDNYGKRADDFNGVVVPLIFGKSNDIETLANDGGEKIKFDVRNNILFSGKTRAENGRFSFTFIVPRDIDYSFGHGKISYYASDENKEMNGSFSDIIVGGFSKRILIDTTGPVIRLFFNDTLFRSGGITGPDPRLLAHIEDKNGINASGSGIGHDISYWLDNERNNSHILNHYYENDLGSYTSGKIIYDFTGLASGRHYLTLKAWDNVNNSSEESIVFVVDTGEKLMLKNLMSYPNPFTSHTRITAEHNRPDEMLDIIITIYSMNGSTVKVIRTSIPVTGYQLPPIEWDGTVGAGKRAGQGIYPYRLEIRTAKGETSTISGRMIIY